MRDPRTYLVEHYALISRSVLVQVLLSLALVFIAHVVLRRRSESDIRPITAWHQVFRGERPPGTTPQVRASLLDGSVYVGTLYAYTTDQASAVDREMVLGPPLWSKRDGSMTRLPEHWQRVVLPASNLRNIAVSYVNSESLEDWLAN